ncbi:transposase [Nocardia sp. NPDC051900]|uniref:transposase n=1 Tax=Nocardia sp. NPDC051900 TaxID=3364326 RepID=UPI00379ED1ED
MVGWSIDSTQTAALVTNALGMAISNRSPASGTIIHSDHGVQFTSWAFTDRARKSGPVPSMGSIGDCYDNAIFDYLEIFHNRRRRHSALGMRTPIEYEMMQPSIQLVA